MHCPWCASTQTVNFLLLTQWLCSSEEFTMKCIHLLPRSCSCWEAQQEWGHFWMCHHSVLVLFVCLLLGQAGVAACPKSKLESCTYDMTKAVCLGLSGTPLSPHTCCHLSHDWGTVLWGKIPAKGGILHPLFHFPHYYIIYWKKNGASTNPIGRRGKIIWRS